MIRKGGMLILAQADHLTGEEIGYAVEQIATRGADNVYVIPGVTKKNRAGCLLLIDVNPESEESWARFLSEELSIYGYHRIDTIHYRSRCRLEAVPAIVRKGGAFFETKVQVKTCADGDGRGRVEHADLVRVRKQVNESLQADVSLSKLRALFESRLCSSPQERIEIIL